MNEEEFLAFIEAQCNRQKLLASFEGFVKIKLENYPGRGMMLGFLIPAIRGKVKNRIALRPLMQDFTLNYY